MEIHPIRFREEVIPSDRDRVREIVTSSGFFSREEIAVAVELVDERMAKGDLSGYYFLFAETDNGVLGYAGFGPIACTLQSYDLYWIAVHEDVRGKGLGKVLLQKAEEKIAVMGGTRIYVDTSSRQQYEPTRAFYEHRGYTAEAVLKDFYAPGDHKVIYVKGNG